MVRPTSLQAVKVISVPLIITMYEIQSSSSSRSQEQSAGGTPPFSMTASGFSLTQSVALSIPQHSNCVGESAKIKRSEGVLGKGERKRNGEGWRKEEREGEKEREREGGEREREREREGGEREREREGGREGEEGEEQICQ